MTYIKTDTTVIIQERVFESCLKDILSTGLLFAMYYLNHTYTNGAWMIDFTVSILFFAILAASGNKNRKSLTLDETIKYLEEVRKVKSN